jgi:hypothetical protein
VLVRHLCYYLTEWGGINPRQEDYNTNKVVKCLKNETIKGYSDITIGGVTFAATMQRRTAPNSKPTSGTTSFTVVEGERTA